MKKYLSFILLLLLPIMASSQRFRQERYKNFDKRLFHFGFMLGYNKADFTVYQDVDAYTKYGLKTLSNEGQPGGQRA